MSSRPNPAASPTEGEPAAPSRDNATEVAATIVSLVKSRLACPETAAQDLRRLLGNSLAVDSAAERRQASLGLLIELVAEGGEFVATTTYEEVRTERLCRGEEWPAASTLSRLYGHWLAAVRAACRFWFDGGPQRVPGSHHHAVGTQRGYQPAEDPLHPAGGQAGPGAARGRLALAVGVLRVGGGQASPHSTLRQGTADPRPKADSKGVRRLRQRGRRRRTALRRPGSRGSRIGTRSPFLAFRRGPSSPRDAAGDP